MKVAVLSTRLPYPPTDGIVIPVYELIRELSKRHELALVCFADAEGHLEERRRHLLGFGQSVQVFHPRPKVAYALPWHWPALARAVPLSVFPYTSRPAQRAVDRLLVEQGYDAVVCHLVHTAALLPAGRSASYATCMIIQDAVYHQIEQNRPYLASWPRRAYAGIDAWLMRRYETTQYRRVDARCVVSQRERERVLALDGGLEVDVVPNGVDADYYRPDETVRKEPAVVYVGALRSYRNEEAAWILTTKIFPSLRARFPELRLMIVGKDPSPRLLDASRQDPAVQVVGAVADVRPFLRRASVYVSPQRVGSGIKNSVLQALAVGLPAVVSPSSVEGIEGQDGRDYLVRRTPAEFVESTARILATPSLAATLGERGRELVLSRYTWRRYAEAIEGMLQRALRRRRPV